MDWKKMYHECLAEKKVLKKENKELKEEKQKVIQDAYQCHYDSWKEEQENIVITELKHKLDCVEADLEEQSNILCEVKEENEKLKEELEGKGTGIYIGDMECSYCPTAITEDDLYMSIECGELTCESCMDKKKKERSR